jgi:hypothetical protein
MTVTVAAVAVVSPQTALRACVTGRLTVATSAATAAAATPATPRPAPVFAVARSVSIVAAVTAATRFIRTLEPLFAISTIGACIGVTARAGVGSLGLPFGGPWPLRSRSGRRV